MSKFEKIIQRIRSGKYDQNISDLCNLLESLGFDNRINGSHHIYFKKGIPEIINLQTNHNKAKAHQVKQVRKLLLRYKLIKPKNE